MGELRILDETGDTAVAWSIDDSASVANARTAFEHLVAERRIPFARAAGAPAGEAELVRSFDPSVEEVVFVWPVAGG